MFFYQDAEVENLHKQTSSYMNLNVFGPKKAIINGNLGEWEYDSADLKTNEKSDSFWNDGKSEFTLGDFNELVNFFITNSGKKEAIETIVK